MCACLFVCLFVCLFDCAGHMHIQLQSDVIFLLLIPVTIHGLPTALIKSTIFQWLNAMEGLEILFQMFSEPEYSSYLKPHPSPSSQSLSASGGSLACHLAFQHFLSLCISHQPSPVHLASSYKCLSVSFLTTISLIRVLESVVFFPYCHFPVSSSFPHINTRILSDCGICRLVLLKFCIIQLVCSGALLG